MSNYLSALLVPARNLAGRWKIRLRGDSRTGNIVSDGNNIAKDEARLGMDLLLGEFTAESKKTDFDQRIPHPQLNYNQSATSSYAEYRREFISQTVLRELPEILKIGGYSESSPDFSMLDYGCGLGRLAWAFTNFFGKDISRRYFGYEIHPSAYAFLLEAYRDFPNTTFISDRLSLQDSYVEIQEGARVEDQQRIDASQVKLQTKIQNKLDLQFSHSVFTHMYREPIIHILKEFGQLLKPHGICLNTWLIVDRFAESTVRCGLADRQLPFEVSDQGFYTYLKENPLMCAAYKIEQVKAIYEAAGHEILDIKWGTWAGRLPTHQISYQDLVVSRPKGLEGSLD